MAETRLNITAIVDGGGSGTRLRLLDSNGNALAETKSGPSSLTYGIDLAWTSIGDAMRSACAMAGLGDPSDLSVRIVAGLAGAKSPENRMGLRAADPFGCSDITVVTDGYGSLMGAFSGGPGIVLAVGTGVTGYSMGPDGTVRESSGWGFPIGDEGGGAWLGYRAVAALTRHLDGRMGPSPLLFDRLRPEVGHDFVAIQLWLRGAGGTKFAVLAPLVVEAARQGDGVAMQIMDDAVAELECAIAAIDPGAGTAPLALLGGLGPIFAELLGPDLRARLQPAQGTALDGLSILSRQVHRWEDFACLTI